MYPWLVMVLSTFLSAMMSLCEQKVESPHIYQIVARDCSHSSQMIMQTGFLVAEPVGIVTALHGVVHCQSITALPGDGVSGAKAVVLEIDQVDIVRDLALLSPVPTETVVLPTNGLQTVSSSAAGALTNLCVIGYPLGISAQLTSQQINVRPHLHQRLADLIPSDQELLAALRDRNSPGPETQVLSLEAALTPGHSGAPIINRYNQVIGVANGGLAKEGAVMISWAMPWQDIVWQPVETQWPALETLRGKDLKLLFPYPQVQPAWCTYALSIYDSATTQAVKTASVQLVIGANPYPAVTDSTGYARFTLPCTAEGTVATVNVTANNYEGYSLALTLVKNSATKILLSRLKPLPTAVTAPIQDLVIKHKPTLEAVIHRSNEIERQANLTLDASLLPSVFRGEVLTRWINAIRSAKQNGYYTLTEQTALRFVDFWVSQDEQFARVSVIQTLQLTVKTVAAQTCIGQAPLQEIPQIYYLERIGGNWMVYQLDSQREPIIQKSCS